MCSYHTKVIFSPIDDASYQGGRGYKIIKTDKEEDLIEIKKKRKKKFPRRHGSRSTAEHYGGELDYLYKEMI